MPDLLELWLKHFEPSWKADAGKKRMYQEICILKNQHQTKHRQGQTCASLCSRAQHRPIPTPSRTASKKKGKNMPFIEEPTGYEKTILSDLQGAWAVLRDSIVDGEKFDGWDRVLFHVDEAMSWESVRNLKRMPPLFLIIRNLCIQGKAPQDIMENIQDLDDILGEVLSEFHN
ncbi:hypothetical protein LZ24_02133 [Desulfobotulus alkaliphilus]|uniref:Uncharacterized protein n=1 Tax=Desulfobotulus alkaliphilus TaxID=622671 RepID=A0A562RQ67_9BACT|nr:hypothetical protein [Desulfobotulus alkaliphilus]TWI71168.1 hypothetical protein LZ24_02133 [Desulfobotulus alkaliphilus]